MSKRSVLCSTKQHKVVRNDCLKELIRIPERSISMVLTDLPYGQTKNKWDNQLDLEKLWQLLARVSKPNAAWIFFAQGMFTSDLMKMTYDKFRWRYNLIWRKDRTRGHLNSKKMPLRNHEDLVIQYAKPPIYHPQMWVGEPLHSAGDGRARGDKNSNYGDFKSDGINRAGSTEKYPRSVLDFKCPHPPIHPTQKPVELCEWLIRTYSNPGNIILDACAGSGTTAVAAEITGRKSYSIELHREYAIDIPNRIIHLRKKV